MEADHIFILYLYRHIHRSFDVVIKHRIDVLLQVSVVIGPISCSSLLGIKWWKMACRAQKATCQATRLFDPRWLPWEPTWMHSVRAKVGSTEAGSTELAKDTFAVCFHTQRWVSVCQFLLFSRIYKLTTATQPLTVALLALCHYVGQWVGNTHPSYIWLSYCHFCSEVIQCNIPQYAGHINY